MRKGNAMLSYDALRTAVSEQAAFRRRQRLQPIGDVGDKVFPPTYPGENRGDPAQHVFERRRLDGENVWTVLLDSVQSSTNRQEETLLRLSRAGKIELPFLSVSFKTTDVPEIGEITSLDAPHRVFDAIMRDSNLDAKPLMKSELGQRLQLAKPANATAIFEASPNALLFGAWNSTGEGGGLGAKFARCSVSEVIGIGVAVNLNERNGKANGDPTPAGRRTGSRIDPLNILRGVPVYKSSNDWDSQEHKGNKDFKKVRPSEINHGNIAPSIVDLGVTMDYAEHSFVIGLAAVRRLGFGNDQRDLAARSAIVALGLVAHLAQIRSGYALRSRCDLVSDGHAPLELVRFDGSTEQIDVSLDDALALYGEAVARAREVGFTIVAAPTRLLPQEKLVYLVKQSRELALAGKGGEAPEGTTDAGA